MKNSLNKFANNESGSIALIVATLFTVVMVMVYLSMDNSKNTYSETLFRNSLDQALLSAASKSSELDAAQMQQETKDFFTVNFAPANLTYDLTKFDVIYNATSKEWEAIAEATAKNLNSTFSGNSTFKLAHTSKVKWDETKVEVVFAVDVSASMCATFDQSARESGKLIVKTDDSCQKMNYVKDALKYIIGGNPLDKTQWAGLPVLKTKNNEPAYKIGIVPFNHKVKFTDLTKIPAPLTQTEPDPAYFKVFNVDPGAAETADYPLAPIMPLTALTSETDRTNILKKIDDIKTFHNVPGWTRSNLGLFTSVLMLDPNYTASFPGGFAPDSFTSPNTKKIIFLLTDGANMGCCYSNHMKSGTADWNEQYLYSYRDDNQHLIGKAGVDNDGLCGQAKEQGVTIYTLVYDVEDKDAGGAGLTIKNVLRECSSGGDNINFYDLKLNEGSKIKEAYQRIAQSLMRLRLTY